MAGLLFGIKSLLPKEPFATPELPPNHHGPLAVVALLGLIAPAGMFMRNTVILVDQIDRDIGHWLCTARARLAARVPRTATPPRRRVRPAILAVRW